MFGGLNPIPSPLGGILMAAVLAAGHEGCMWVRPNPFLLQERDIVVIPKQVFVVQAATLSETVLPLIRDMLSKEGYSVKYFGDRSGTVVLQDIWIQLNQAELVIVDFTGKRPNVYMEFGMALVLGKPIIAISQSLTDVPTDTSNLKCILYGDSIGSDRKLQSNLIAAIRDRRTEFASAPIGRRF